MTQRKEIPLVGGSREGISVYADPQRTVNMFLERDRGRGRDALINTPGLVEKLDLTETDLQSDQITSGDFSADSDWTKGSGQWTISSDKLRRAAGGSADNTEQTVAQMVGATAPEEDETHRLTFTVVTISGGVLVPSVAGTDGDPVVSPGTYTMDIVAGASGGVKFTATASLALVMGDVSLTQVINLNYSMRGMHIMGDYLYVVHGPLLKRIDSDFTVTTINANTPMATKAGLVDMSSIWNLVGGRQLFICDGTIAGYVYDDSSGSFTRLDESDYSFLGGLSGTAQDGFFISGRPNSPDFFHSAVNNGLIWNALDVARAEVKPTDTLRILSHKRNLWVWKKKSTEVFYNSGDAELVFKRRSGGNLEIGLGAKWSVSALQERLTWLGHNKHVYSAIGMSAVDISTPQTVARMEALSKVDDAVSFSYGQGGHEFYVISFPTDDVTFSYDFTEEEWHERKSWKDNIDGYGRHRGNTYALFENYHLVGDYRNNKIYYLDPDVYTEDGNTVIRQRTVPNVINDRYRIIVKEVELEMEPGTGAVSGQGSSPEAMVELSYNGGKSWNPPRITDIGALGEYEARARWFQLGSARTIGLRFTISDPIKTVMVAGFIGYEGGYH
ncbi:MAG: hypothetical protein KOO63_05550 [Bacteroidales bacterium]|nr:hypothetical protein [Candidatus Latescibacterota bacterium]